MKMDQIGRTIVLLCVFSWLGSQQTLAQTCLEGDCENGFGELDSGDSFYVGSFHKGKWDGPGVHYNKVTGSITMSFYKSEQPTISIVEFYSGDLELGYRKKGSDGKMYLHNGFNFTERGLFKFVEGRKSPLDFDFRKSKCLIGNCQEGFGAEYLIAIDIKKDTAAFLFVGYYKAETWSGEGAYYEFVTGDFFVGKFMNNREWDGALINSEDGLASFMVGGKEIKTLGYEIPEVPPGQAKLPDGQKKGSFWKGLGDFSAESSGISSRQGPRGEIALVNRTSRKMKNIFIATQEAPGWSKDLLDPELSAGQLAKVAIPTGYGNSCTISVKVEYTDGTTGTWKDLDLCKHFKFDLLPDGKVNASVE